MNLLYTAAQIREMEQLAAELDGQPTYGLMQQAGAAAFALARERWPRARRWCVLAGKGNNAGDGFVLARLAHQQGIAVRVLLAYEDALLNGDAAQAYGELLAAGLSPEPWSGAIPESDLLIDALLGSGAQGAPKAPLDHLIDAINAAALPVLALDLPSGLNADTGATAGAVVRADLSLAFVGLKAGMVTGQARDVTGICRVAELDLATSTRASTAHTATLLQWQDVSARLPRRRRCAHKGEAGHLLVIGGAEGYCGAAILAAEAALAAGAGRVSLHMHQSGVSAALTRSPELMVSGFAEKPDQARLQVLVSQCSAIVIGPGLSRASWAAPLVRAIALAGKPLLMDADALHALSGMALTLAHAVLTPHSGEAAALLHASVNDIEADRYAAARAIQHRYHAVTVLKGAGSLIADAGHIHVCAGGNPGMAAAGMGDVLSGVIGALLAQGMSAEKAAQLGVCWHAAAGDEAALAGETGMRAGDLLPALRKVAAIGRTTPR